MTKSIYLVQRCEIKRPLGDYRGKKFSEAVRCDYMGSAEFEFGALPQSLRRLEAIPPKMRKVESIKDGDAVLRVLSNIPDDEWEDYVKQLERLRNDKIRTKESSRFAVGAEKRSYGTVDLWWDIENDAMFSFDKSFMNSLVDVLDASFKYMNSK